MSNRTNGKQSAPSYLLSNLLGAKVTSNGKKIGKFADVSIIDGDVAAEVTHFLVTRPFGNPSLLVPWEKVKSMTTREIVIDVEDLHKYEAEPPSGTVLLRDHILDKRVLDVEGREVEVVYDVRLVLLHNLHSKLYITEVDVSRYGLIRRMGLQRLADFIYNMLNRMKSEPIPWSYIEPLPTEISSFKGDLKLKIVKERLSEMHPVDVADILEKMEPEQRVAVFDELDTSHASDTLEEIDPRVQRMILSSLSKEKIARLVNEMTPGQAADVLAVLPSSEMRDILELLNSENASKIQAILEKHEEKALNFATSNFLKFAPNLTVRQARRQYGQVAGMSDVIMYLYIVDEQDKLLGVVDIRELIKANDDAQLKDIMRQIVASLNPKSTLREAAATFNRYSFRALPIVDDADRILGVVSYRDMMTLKHRFLE
jgi:CBS domain-containing protein/sporulation protein YlmC with PRC-barrel domain